MNRKGFTLVELLAVVAILSILVIISLPNIMGMFNDAKQSSFKTELKEVYKLAEQTWIADSLFSTGEKEYSRCADCNGKELDLTGRKELNYYIKINKAGKVVQFYATDGTYQYGFNNSEGLQVEDINTVQEISGLQSNEVINISSNNVEIGETVYLYSSEGSINYGQEAHVDEYYHIYDNYQTALSNNPINSNEASFTRAKVSGGVVSELAVGFVYNGSVYYLNGVDSGQYQKNVQLLTNLLPAGSCTTSSYENYDEYNNVTEIPFIECRVPANGSYPAYSINVVSNGQLHTYTPSSGWICQVGYFAGNYWASNCVWD